MYFPTKIVEISGEAVLFAPSRKYTYCTFTYRAQETHQIISFHICVLLIFIHNVADPGCLSRIQNPGSDFYHPGSQILDPDPHQSAKVFLTQKSDTKFSKIRSGMFIPTRIPDPDPVVKKAPA